MKGKKWYMPIIAMRYYKNREHRLKSIFKKERSCYYLWCAHPVEIKYNYRGRKRLYYKTLE